MHNIKADPTHSGREASNWMHVAGPETGCTEHKNLRPTQRAGPFWITNRVVHEVSS